MAEDDDDGDDDGGGEEAAPRAEGPRALRFSQPLNWRAGRAIPVAELHKRLGALCNELRPAEQDEIERASLLPVAKELASHQLLSHKDKGVRAWTACCVVEVFRICAPDAPFSASQLKDIFTMIINHVFPALADPTNPWNTQHSFVLKSLADVKSIVLLCDIPGANNLILHLFEVCFDVLSGGTKADSGEELSKNVEHHMTELLQYLVDESQGLPGEVVEVILAQFLRADPRALAGTSSKGKKGNSSQHDERQSTLLLKEAPPAYNMAKNICNFSPEKMARYISQYFSSVIVDASTARELHQQHQPRHGKRGAVPDSDEVEDDLPRGPTAEEWEESQKAHRLLRELWRSTPSVLQDIVPQLEVELAAEHGSLRLLATETLGDMVAGIGAAGPPAPPTLDPAAYPSQSLLPPAADRGQTTYNFLTTPSSPHSFPSRHPQIYQAFLSRRNDRAPAIRAAWVTGVGRILMTSAGGVGLDADEEQALLRYLADMLVDVDERVRLAAVRAVERFDFEGVLQKLGSRGGVAEPGGVLANLADRVKDRKHGVRTEATMLLGRLWGVASGAIAEGSDRVAALLGPIPSKIFEAYYINDTEINALVDTILFESLLPLKFPPIKSKGNPPSFSSQQQLSNGGGGGGSQRARRSAAGQQNGDAAGQQEDPDRIRAERILILVRGLEHKAKTAFFARQGQQSGMAKFVDAYLAKCEDYNGGVMESNEKETKQQLTRLVDALAKYLPEPLKVSDDLWKFAKKHDRRCYQLIRFCMLPDSDYKRVYNAMKEFTKRIEEAFGHSSSVLDTFKILIYRAGVLVYNKSHVPAIIQYSRTNEKDLGPAAHDVLKEISTHKAEVFRAHVQELCQSLKARAPTSAKPNWTGAVDDLKACSGFARKFPEEMPKERAFTQALFGFALHGVPPKAAKYGTQILLTISERKAMHARDLVAKCTKGWTFGKDNFLSKLAALSQVMLLTPQEIEDDVDGVTDLALNEVLLKNRVEPEDGDPRWSDAVDDEMAAKLWALKILTNRLLAHEDDGTLKAVAERPFRLLNRLVADGGEVSKKGSTPPHHKARLRLAAAQHLLRLACQKRLDHLLGPRAFNQLAVVAQDPLLPVRTGFVRKLMKYLGQDRLQHRFYAVIFLLAFEPDARLKEGVTTWTRARAAEHARRKATVLEAAFARFLSLLAHHPDFDPDDEDGLADFAQYILFYLRCVANQDNLSLIYHVAQRVKSATPAADQPSINLYILSDLSQEVIRRFEEQRGWSMQAWPGRLRLPGGIFAPLPGHEAAVAVANAQFAPERLVERLDDIVRDSLRRHASKRARTTGPGSSPAAAKDKGARRAKRMARTPRRARGARRGAAGDGEDDGAGLAGPSSADVAARRRSGRHAGGEQKRYVELSDEEQEEVDEEEEEEQEEEDVQMGEAAASSEDDSQDGEEEEERSAEEEESGAEDASEKAAADGAEEDELTSPSPRLARGKANGTSRARGPVPVKAKGGVKKPPPKAPVAAAVGTRRSTRRV
ncbi:armadillo-type protein [Lineolata rhizophorae]|uniref:Armadillo-type protein n=1 Tax=Lineolata rhizophorae TaxID=578093 RepID=A0A6A6NYB7_9PEZI|nr:armadillo-type protein [Lineolata rhizophorae]